MGKTDSDLSNIYLLKSFWALFSLTGFFSLAFSGIFILVVPLSSLFWPSEPYHALEMGFMITSMFWTNSVAGLLFGRLIDKFNRTKILLLISIIRGTCMIMLSFTIVGLGISSWVYFYIFTFMIGISAGGNYPTIASLSNDLIPLNSRSRFFGIRNIIRSIFRLNGFVLTGLLVLLDLWRIFFVLVGIGIILFGFLMFLTIKEPKRGVLRRELSEVLKDDAISYDFQLDLKMMRKTIFSKTNIVALVEGIFTSVFMGSLTILFLPYIQTEPHNFSPFVTGAFLAFFGLTVGIFLKLLLAKLSDKLSKKNDIARIYSIIIALSAGTLTFVLIFYIPLPHFTIEEGKNIALFFSFPIVWLTGIIESASSSISSLYEINQPPVLQQINLPEAQGQVVSFNRLLEAIGWGSGPLITGIFIQISGNNYQLVALIIGIFALPGIILWAISIKWYQKDKKVISLILEERAVLLDSKHNNQSEKNE
ncbi:MAG: MFS transporter [Candidatus Lokiarchaeota archaeon]|nr:MFS transporter [Candidatus Lokiarchaeota archaeon]